MNDKRLFVAVELPQEVRRELREVCNHFADIELFSGWCTKEENFHVTLDFIGSVDLKDFSEVDKALKQVYANSCNAKLKNLGVLPSRRVPKILFADLDCYCLPIIARQVEQVTLPFKREQRFEIVDLGFGVGQSSASNRSESGSSIGFEESLIVDFSKDSFSKNRKKKNREFKTHVTLARIKEIVDLENFLYAVDNFNLPEMTFEIKEFVLMESILLPNGPVYETLVRYSLY